MSAGHTSPIREGLDAQPGTTCMDGNSSFPRRFVRARRLLSRPQHEGNGKQEPRFVSNSEVWAAAISERGVLETRRIHLEHFTLTEWVPLSPGQYHTLRGEQCRSIAKERYIIEQSKDGVLFDPYGKGWMVEGGIGCLRLNTQTVGQRRIKYLSATHDGNAHAGFIVAMPADMYGSVIEDRLKESGGVMCTISGVVCAWDRSISSGFDFAEEVPLVYMLADDLRDIKSTAFPNGWIDVSIAVTFQGRVEGHDGTFLTYTHFDPSLKGSMAKEIAWLRDEYVSQRYQGRVITDFDEYVPHFRNAEFPVQKLMDPKTSVPWIVTTAETHFALGDGPWAALIAKDAYLGGPLTETSQGAFDLLRVLPADALDAIEIKMKLDRQHLLGRNETPAARAAVIWRQIDTLGKQSLGDLERVLREVIGIGAH